MVVQSRSRWPAHKERRARQRQQLAAAINKIRRQEQRIQYLKAATDAVALSGFECEQTSITGEVIKRLAHEAPCLQAQWQASQRGAPAASTYTARGWVDDDTYIMRGAAAHNFKQPIDNLCPREAKRQKRGAQQCGRRKACADDKQAVSLALHGESQQADRHRDDYMEASQHMTSSGGSTAEEAENFENCDEVPSQSIGPDSAFLATIASDVKDQSSLGDCMRGSDELLPPGISETSMMLFVQEPSHALGERQEKCDSSSGAGDVEPGGEDELQLDQKATHVYTDMRAWRDLETTFSQITTTCPSCALFISVPNLKHSLENCISSANIKFAFNPDAPSFTPVGHASLTTHREQPPHGTCFFGDPWRRYMISKFDLNETDSCRDFDVNRHFGDGGDVDKSPSHCDESYATTPEKDEGGPEVVNGEGCVSIPSGSSQEAFAHVALDELHAAVKQVPNIRIQEVATQMDGKQNEPKKRVKQRERRARKAAIAQISEVPETTEHIEQCISLPVVVQVRETGQPDKTARMRNILKRAGHESGFPVLPVTSFQFHHDEEQPVVDVKSRRAQKRDRKKARDSKSTGCSIS